MSSGVARDVLQQVINLIRGGLVGAHNHSGTQGGPIVTDQPITTTNALQPTIITRSQMLNQNLNADYWRGHAYTISKTAPLVKGTGDIWVNSSGGFGGYVFNIWDGREWQPLVSGSSSFTSGSVIFAGATGLLSQDNPNFFWNDTKYQLDIGTTGTGTYKGFLGLGRNGDFTLAGVTPNWLRIGGGFNIAFWANGNATSDDNPQMFLSNTGYLGIGTVSPAATLDVNGSLILQPMTQGSIPFIGASGLVSQDNANLLWNATNHRLILGGAESATSQTKLQVVGTTSDVARLGTFCAVDVSKYGYSEMAMYLRNPAATPVDVALFSFGAEGNYSNASALTPYDFYIYNAPASKYSMYVDGVENDARFDTGVKIFQTAALTPGSVGSLIAPYATAVSAGTDALFGTLNGGCGAVYNSSGPVNKWYARTNGTWKGVSITGFSIPNYSGQIGDDGTVGVDETTCPLCHDQMKPGQGLGMYADHWEPGDAKNPNRSLHAVAAHLKCLNELN